MHTETVVMLCYSNSSLHHHLIRFTRITSSCVDYQARGVSSKARNLPEVSSRVAESICDSQVNSLVNVTETAGGPTLPTTPLTASGTSVKASSKPKNWAALLPSGVLTALERYCVSGMYHETI